jgi:hypothetical protein
MFDFAIPMRLGGHDAGAYVGRSRDWVETWAAPWDDKPIPSRVRFKYEGADRRYYPRLPPIPACTASMWWKLMRRIQARNAPAAVSPEILQSCFGI